MENKSLGIILFALRELQSSIQYAPEEILECLRDHFGVDIPSSDLLYDEIDKLAEDLNCDDEYV